MSIHAVIIAGGKGKRFWPQSRAKYPKYFLKLPGEKRTLLQEAVYRLNGLVPSDNIVIATNKLQAAGVRKQLPQIKAKNIICEPVSRNTASAIALAAKIINEKDPYAVMMVLPADQFIKSIYIKQFQDALWQAALFAKTEDALVTIGIKPTFASTGFGYIESGKKIKGNVFKADKFIEKPDLKNAKRFIRNEKYLWNSGIFIWKTSVILKEVETHMPNLAKGLKKIKTGSGLKGSLNRHYKNFPDISVDYGIMEKTKKKYTVKSPIRWCDVGSWKNLCDVVSKDKEKNIVMGSHIGVNTKNSIIIAGKNHFIGTVGLKDIVIVHTPDATLVCRKKDSEAVKKLVEKLEAKKLKKFL